MKRQLVQKFTRGGSIAYKQGIHPGFETQGKRHQKFKNNGINGSTKNTSVLQRSTKDILQDLVTYPIFDFDSQKCKTFPGRYFRALLAHHHHVTSAKSRMKFKDPPPRIKSWICYSIFWHLKKSQNPHYFKKLFIINICSFFSLVILFTTISMFVVACYFRNFRCTIFIDWFQHEVSKWLDKKTLRIFSWSSTRSTCLIWSIASIWEFSSH